MKGGKGNARTSFCIMREAHYTNTKGVNIFYARSTRWLHMATLTKLRWNTEGGRLFFLCLRPLSQQYTEGKLLISKVKLFFEQDLKSVVRLQANARVCQVRYNLVPLVWSSTYCFISYFEVFWVTHSVIADP